MAVVGFDIGYQTSLFAAPRGGGIDVLLNDYSQRQTASFVAFTEKQRFQGEAARQKYVINFRNTITGLKRLIGRQYNDADVQAELASVHFRHTELPNGRVGFVVNAHGEEKTLAVEQVLANFIYKLRQCTESELKTKVTDCVIGVPCWFNDEQRHCMLDAVRTAGINCLGLMNETAAVALAYGIYKQDLPEEKEKPRRVIFVDFGHSQLQMCCAEFNKGKLSMVGSACDKNLGGRDFDQLLVTHLSKEFQEKYKLDVPSNHRATIRLETECEKLKKLMSTNTQALPINIECLMEDRDVSARLSREEFEGLAADLLARVEATAMTLKEMLRCQEITMEDIYAVEIVGGSTRIPAVKAILARVFDKEVSTTLNTDEAVVRGCALKGAIVSPTFRVREFSVIDRTPYAITMAWKKGDEEEDSTQEVYAENAPTNTTKIYSFVRKNDFDLQVAYKDSARVPGRAATIGSFAIKGVQPSFDGESQKVKVKVRMNEFGCFSVESAVMSDKLQPEPEPEPEAESEPKPMDTDDAAAAAADGDNKEEKKDKDSKKDSKKDEKKDEKKDDKKDKKVKTHRSVPLIVEANQPYVRSAAELNELQEAELAMLSLDKMEIEKSNAKNSLEEYIYDMRDKLSGIYTDYIKESDREDFSASLTSAENWLYEDGEDQPKNAYIERLTKLKETGSPVANRYLEAQNRPDAEQALEKSIVQYRKFLDAVAAGSEDYAHIDKEKVEKVAKAVEEKAAFINTKKTEQSKLAKYDPPAVLVAALVAQKEELERICRPVVNTPKPKAEPPKEEPKKEAEAEAEAEAEVKPEGEGEAKEGDAADAAAAPSTGDNAMDLD